MVLLHFFSDILFLVGHHVLGRLANTHPGEFRRCQEETRCRLMTLCSASIVKRKEILKGEL